MPSLYRGELGTRFRDIFAAMTVFRRLLIRPDEVLTVRPEFPVKGLATLQAARDWGASFVHWYNVEHKHSGIRYVSPQQRHAGEDHAILAARHALYTAAKRLNPGRWSRNTRNWQPMGPVTLNPERDSIISEHSGNLI